MGLHLPESGLRMQDLVRSAFLGVYSIRSCPSLQTYRCYICGSLALCQGFQQSLKPVRWPVGTQPA